MRASLSALLVSITTILSANAQEFNNYKLLRSQGEMPEKFYTSSSEKYKAESEQAIDNTEKKRVRKVKDQFLLESSFSIDDILRGGMVIYNDPVGQYLNKVLDELLKDDKELRSQVEVYAVKSPMVNAFTTSNGVILFHMGLLAQFENEAQLAYILSHEVMHYKKKHAITRYVEKDDIVRGRGQYRGTSYQERMLAGSKYSKSQEKEADIEGLQLFLKSKYSCEDIANVFDVLRYSHLPFDLVEYKKEFLETDYLKLPSDFFLKDTKPITADDDEDSLGTHPGALARQEYIKQETSDIDCSGKSQFIVSEKEFFTIQKMSRYEIANILIENRHYEHAFYHTYMLLKEEPANLYLNKCLLKSLYGLTKYKNAGKFYEVHTTYQNIEGPEQQVFHMFEKMNAEELNAISLRYAWALKSKFSDEKEIKMLTTHLLQEYIYHHQDDIGYFSKKSLDELTQDSTSIRPDGSLNKLSKYDKIKANENSEDIIEKDFVKYGFVDLVNTESFINAFSKGLDSVKVLREEDELKNSWKYRNKLAKENRRKRQKGYALGIEKVVFVNPFYYKIDERKKNSLRYLAGEEAQKEFSQTISENAIAVGLDYEILDNKHMRGSETEKFNDLMFLTNYVDEIFDHHDDINIFYNNHEEVQKIAKKYGTKYFCWSGVYAVKEQKSFPIGGLLLGAVLYPILPLVAYDIVKPEHELVMAVLVLDVEKGEWVFASYENYDYKDRNDILNAILYDTCNQLKTKRKRS